MPQRIQIAAPTHDVAVRLFEALPECTVAVVDRDGEWLVVRGIDTERIPDLVAESVRSGGRVYAGQPAHESLEDRFLSLLAEDARR